MDEESDDEKVMDGALVLGALVYTED